MASRTPVPFTTPIGRLVWGDVHKAQLQTEDDNRTPKKIKTGQNAGQDLYMFNFGVAIPKTPGRDWKDEEWGRAIAAEALACWPGGQTQQPGFSYKVTDGDSTIPNSNMKRPCDKAGHPGNWIIAFGGMTAPQLWNAVGTEFVPLMDVNDLTPGDFCQINFEIKSNESAKKPGVYLNPRAACFRGYDQVNGKIQAQQSVNPNVFGSAGVAAGAAVVPPSMPGTSGAPSAAAPAPVPPAAAPAPVAPPAPTAVTPDPSFIPTPPPTPRMAHKDGSSWPVASMTGWTEATLLQHGYTITGG